MDTEGAFHILTCIRGSAYVKAARGGESVLLAKGRTALLPAALGAYTLAGGEEDSRVLVSWAGGA
jgi:mannose-6-phosphate isomerase class I